MNRLAFLDSFRAIAITGVALFHYLSLWAAPDKNVTLYPYGDRFSDVFAFKYGYFGVELFFLISGFVITLTLRHCDGLYDFAVKRFARLWPALVFFTIVAFVFKSTTDIPFGPKPNAIDLVPSLTTIGPRFFDFTGSHAEYVIGSVWSLFVEIRFYAIAALIYFFAPRRQFVVIMLSLSLGAMLLALARGNLDGAAGAVLTVGFLVRHIGWLALGAYCCNLHEAKQNRIESILAFLNWVALAGVCAAFPEQSAPAMQSGVIALAISAVFVATTMSPMLQRGLSNPVLIHVGVVSYSFYLLHEFAGVALISKIDPTLPVAAQFALVAAIYAAMVALSTLTYRFVEVPFRDILKNWLLPRRAATVISAPGAGSRR